MLSCHQSGNPSVKINKYTYIFFSNLWEQRCFNVRLTGTHGGTPELRGWRALPLPFIFTPCENNLLFSRCYFLFSLKPNVLWWLRIIWKNYWLGSSLRTSYIEMPECGSSPHRCFSATPTRSQITHTIDDTCRQIFDARRKSVWRHYPVTNLSQMLQAFSSSAHGLTPPS